MVDERLVYAKTAKGVAEVNARSAGLGLLERRVLIMIDGKRTVADLAPFVRPGEIGTVIAQLEAQGLVYPAHAGASAPAAPQATDHGDDSDERLAANFDALKRRAVRELSDRLGPDAEVLAIKIEQAKTTEDLRHRLQEAERLISGFLGEAHAQEFLRALRRR